MNEAGMPSFDQPLGPGAPQERLVPAVFAAVAAAVIGALLWAAVTVVTDFQIGFMAIGVGVLVGLGVRHFGRGETNAYRAVAAVAAGIGCALGNLLTGAHVFSAQIQVPVTRVLEALDMQLTSDLMIALFSPMDLLFYGLAIQQAWKLAVASDEEVDVDDFPLAEAG